MTYTTIIKELKKNLLKDIGKPCKDVNIDCFTCRLWFAYEQLKALTDVYDV